MPDVCSIKIKLNSWDIFTPGMIHVVAEDCIEVEVPYLKLSSCALNYGIGVKVQLPRGDIARAYTTLRLSTPLKKPHINKLPVDELRQLLVRHMTNPPLHPRAAILEAFHRHYYCKEDPHTHTDNTHTHDNTFFQDKKFFQ
eukprot:GHVR01084411.1.p1 GENE.GHVR01084411.1~~GHVR01084411.1.p1  ORF type:complete len:141 (+),score=39.98 GHVR01084411.1:391-813(+)